MNTEASTIRQGRRKRPARPTLVRDNQSSTTVDKELMKSPERFFNRELSWLDFNMRVLEEAENTHHPVLERLRFLSISASNLDEFFMVRLAGLREYMRKGVSTISQDGLTPEQQVDRIVLKSGLLMDHQQRIWTDLQSELKNAGVELISSDDLTDNERKFIDDEFQKNIFPLLTPIAIGPANPFPFIPNKGFAICFSLERGNSDEPTFGLVPLPAQVTRFLQLPEVQEGDLVRQRYIGLEDVIPLFLDQLFTGGVETARCVFQVIRDSDIELEEEAEDLIREFKIILKRRRRGELVRVHMQQQASDEIKQFLRKELNAEAIDVREVNGLLVMDGLSALVDGRKPKHLFTPFEPRFPERIREHNGDCFAAIREKDILVHHPYESFDVVVQFVRQAAADPNVVAIKQTLYRTSKNSPIVAALIEAAESGKNVTALVEIKARFDEEANMRWARDLESAGVQVVYGFIEYKTHAKVSYVVRREGRELRTYTHYGTGNYHPITAKIYTDLSLFTADAAFGRDAGRLFNYVTGNSEPQELEQLSLSPLNLKSNLIDMIEEEIDHAKASRPAAIWAKMNSLVDPEVIDALYRASQNGVIVELIIRGICCLRPKVEGLSDNIEVKSIVGRFLEHPRIVCFGAGAGLPSPEAKVFISSADWMPRNLDRRVEALVPVLNPTTRSQVLDQIMVANLNDQSQSWLLQQDGDYVRVATSLVDEMQHDELFSAHAYFMENPSLSGRGSALELAPPPQLKPQ